MMNLIFCPRLRVTRKLRIVTYVNYIFSLGYNTPSFSIQHFGQGGEDMKLKELSRRVYLGENLLTDVLNVLFDSAEVRERIYTVPRCYVLSLIKT